ncbi:MAG: DEAD/DEAH box helicase [SAR324 cluster bacterium]|nr:DEAD/DEAH box helicase [SAR324 cluster bacterium]
MSINSASPLQQLPNTFRTFYGAFSQLHPAQKQAIAPILEGFDLILQAKTGSGKTEAVLAPALERVIQSQGQEAILYIVPTRALAIDLERRLMPRIERLGLHLSIRTGDTKRKGGGHPNILLTTPESFDVALGSSNRDLRGFMKRVRIVIIDEIHFFVHSYRGIQLDYLLKRLELRSVMPLQKIALSATIADINSVLQCFHFSSETVKISTSMQREIIPHLVHLQKEEELIALINDFYDAWGYRKILIFSNSRGCCDQLFALLNQRGRFRGVCELHYSNLKTKERRGVEKRLRQRKHVLCIATSTLELGIDIGNVDAVLLYEPPDSVSTFLQRIGRSNRREQSINFWGICRGENAGYQLLRFLGLLQLARQSVIESPLPKSLSSVLIQQILSCLYEKKQLSLLSLQQLFPDIPSTLKILFESMISQSWLRQDRVKGLFRGAWRYRDYLLDRKIWSNFPETEDDYILELSGESIADLPVSVVKQLEVGDRVQLAGKRIQILQIEKQARKRVMARPVETVDDKDIIWLGSGFQISYEVAQSIRKLLQTPEVIDEDPTLQLFTRPQKLWKVELEQHQRAVKLANGMELGRKFNGLYQYRTFLGSLGNLLLHWTIEHSLAAQEGLIVVSDAIGIECTHLVDFQQLQLPTNRDAFYQWAASHRKALCAVFPLNEYSFFLPINWLIDELTDFLFDDRIADIFSVYMNQTSDIVEGDPAVLEWQISVSQEKPFTLHNPVDSEPLLNMEKKRWDVNHSSERFALSQGVQHQARAITGSLVGEYIRHQQCPRWLSFQFLPLEQQPPQQQVQDGEIQKIQIEQGKLHETQIQNYLKEQQHQLVIIDELDVKGRHISLKNRFDRSLQQLQKLIHQVATEPKQEIFLAQAVLIVPELLNQEGNWLQQINGVGIPDLIRISLQNDTLVLEAGDIKGSRSPHYHQKWQVAFYAMLLKALIHSQILPATIHVAKTGFLWTRSHQEGEQPNYHTFELEPYLHSFSALLKNMKSLLLQNPRDTTYHLQEHCTTCPHFEYCYQEALQTQDLMFLPDITAGVWQKLQHLNLQTIEQAYECIYEPEDALKIEILSPNQQETLQTQLFALCNNQILLRQQKTRLYPENLSTAIFFQIIVDPVTGSPRALGWEVLDYSESHAGISVESQVQLVKTDNQWPFVWKSFSEQFVKIWKNGIHGTRGPHIFYFGEKNWNTLQKWGVGHELDFLWNSQTLHRTNLHQLISQHFDFPAPGRRTLFAIGHLLGLTPRLTAPPSLFHLDAIPVPHPYHWANDQVQQQEISDFLQNSLSVQKQVWQWASSQLVSEWEQEWDSIETDHALANVYWNFIEEEQRLKEEDILTLQNYSLPERVERFRAVGPLTFSGISLDEQGHFLYDFEIDPTLPTSKFREGDFLKLAPIATTDLQSGFSIILVYYSRNQGKLRIRSRQGKLNLNQQLPYSLEEDLTDWNSSKLKHVVKSVFSQGRFDALSQLFLGKWEFTKKSESQEHTREWLRQLGIVGQHSVSGLNSCQQQALMLPFQYEMSLIEGPPGTGKTHLLGWILIALIAAAKRKKCPLRIVVSALTHQAIDHVLKKVVSLVNAHSLDDFPAQCFKWGRWKTEDSNEKKQVLPLTSSEEIFQSSYVILGATGFGLYQLFEGKKGAFPPIFDWVVFDEASQVLIPQALLSLVYGKQNYLFLGDVKQLPPIVQGKYPSTKKEHLSSKSASFEADDEGIPAVNHSILSLLLERYKMYSIRLNQTYRMNQDLCTFPSHAWYDGQLYPDPANANSRLQLRHFYKKDWLDSIIAPDSPLSLVLLEHQNCHQKSLVEAEFIAKLAHRLMIQYDLPAAQLAIISPHRAQNNAIADYLQGFCDNQLLEYPLIDTVERVQGAEREVILFSFTTSDLDYINSEFLNNPNRFNVAITRGKQKLIVVGNRVFFSTVACSEEGLQKNFHFKAFMAFCQKRECVFELKGSH